MKLKMPSISAKLDRIRREARLLYRKGFHELAIELMRISRGEVKIEAGSNLLSLTASDIKKARKCTLLQRQIIAANLVENSKFGTSEEDYHDAIQKMAQGNPRWPNRSPKDAVIKEISTKHKISESSLRRFMKTEKGWRYEDLTEPHFLSPDWHPTNSERLFKG
jgi:hypothetical protein